MKNLLSITKLGLVGAFLTVGFSGCGGSSSNSSSNSLQLSLNSSAFTISLNKSSDSGRGDYYRVGYVLKDNDGKEIIDYGLNYKGSLKTTCSTSYSSRDYNAYSCATHYSTNAPFGDPSDKSKDITLYDSKTYSLYLLQYVLLGDTKETKIKSFSLN